LDAEGEDFVSPRTDGDDGEFTAGRIAIAFQDGSERLVMLGAAAGANRRNAAADGLPFVVSLAEWRENELFNKTAGDFAS
jgi:hypothetical protein